MHFSVIFVCATSLSVKFNFTQCKDKRHAPPFCSFQCSTFVINNWHVSGSSCALPSLPFSLALLPRLPFTHFLLAADRVRLCQFPILRCALLSPWGLFSLQRWSLCVIHSFIMRCVWVWGKLDDAFAGKRVIKSISAQWKQPRPFTSALQCCLNI